MLARMPMLRQQEVIADGRPNRSLADFIAPVETGVPDYIGMFAITAGLGADELAKKFEQDHDDYNAIMFLHPEAKYFNVARIGRDQLEEYAKRKGEAIEVTERWLASNLSYEPAEFSVKC